MTRIELIKNLQEILKEYNALARELGGELNGLQKYLADGRFLEGVSGDAVREKLGRLEDKQDELFGMYERMGVKKFPSDTAEAADILKGEKAALQKEICLSQIGQVLCLHTEDPAAQAALDQHKERLKDLNPDEMDIDRLQEVMHPYAALLAYITADEPDAGLLFECCGLDREIFVAAANHKLCLTANEPVVPSEKQSKKAGKKFKSKDFKKMLFASLTEEKRVCLRAAYSNQRYQIRSLREETVSDKEWSLLKSRYKKAAEELYKEGYLKKVKVRDQGSYFALTDRGMQVFASKSALKCLGMDEVEKSEIRLDYERCDHADAVDEHRDRADAAAAGEPSADVAGPVGFTSVVPEEKAAEEPEDVAEKKAVEELKNTEEPEDVAEPEAAEEPEDVAEKKASEEPEVIEESEDTKESVTIEGPEFEESKFAALLKENNVLLSKDADLGIFSVKRNTAAENKKVSSSIFMNDMRNKYIPVEKCIIQAMDARGLITREYLVEVKGVPYELAETTLDYFFRRGYVCKFVLMKAGTIFCPTKRLMEAMTYKECSRFAGIRRKTREDWGEDVEDNPFSAAVRMAYMNLFCDGYRRFMEKDVRTVCEIKSMWDKAFQLWMYAKEGCDDIELAVGACWTDVGECDGFLEALTERPEECGHITRLFVAGIDQDHAAALMKVLLELPECEFAGAQLYVYALFEKQYYTYPDLVPVDEENIGAARPEEETEADAKAEEVQAEDPESETEAEKIQTKESEVDAKAEEVQKEESESAVEPELKPAAEEPEAVTKPEPELKPAAEEPEAVTKPEPDLKPAAEGPEAVTKPESETAAKTKPEPAAQEPGSSTKPESEPEPALPVKRTEPAPAAPAKKTAAEDFRTTLCRILLTRKFYAAAAFARLYADGDEDSRILSRQIAYALNDPMENCIYTTDVAFSLIGENSELADALVIAISIRTFFSNQVRYDYNIKSFYSGIKGYDILGRYPALSKAVYSLMDFKSNYRKGMVAYAGYRLKSHVDLKKDIQRVQKDASDFYENFVLAKKKETAPHERFLLTKRLIFSANSDMGQCLKAVADDDREYLSLVLDYLQENFYKEDSTISEETIDGDKLWSYICTFWDKAGDCVMYRRHENLMSSFRTNITNMTTKAVRILARWCVLMERAGNQQEDDGSIAYQRGRGPLIDNLKEARSALNADIRHADAAETAAGLVVLEHTLGEVLGCIDGSYDENARRYYYAPFLLTDDIMLDEEFMPDLQIRAADIESLQPANRILAHLEKVSTDSVEYTDRLRQILAGQSDDYGAAARIAAYLSDTDSEQAEDDVSEKIERGRAFAKDAADLHREDFIGELELAQSYGQIDNSLEDKKEKILQIVNTWYEWAQESSNFGFFKKVMDGYLDEIRKSAKSREADLIAQLDAFKETQVPGITAEAKEKRIDRIDAMIREQNYTVAEDLLARMTSVEDEQESLAEEDFLADFLENYDDYYQPVASHQKSFANLVSNRTRNKEERGAKRLAENWLLGGGHLGKDRLRELLRCLGFKPEKITVLNPIEKFENFVVITASATGGQRENYTHPVAAFGSGASQEGFRVVCINGRYDADGLIDIMKKIGNAKHTLILLDHALGMSERRRLARKSKTDLSDKMFGVLDRTVMMFLIRNFDETKMMRMLISLIAPFAYYQPYVWESANVMPPEIFMGRKAELERIKSATGVNIVYGGRQLGKSALLKKAKDDIDLNENGDRAVYIEIKGLKFEEAARKIGHELYDQQILTESIDTTDWDELARAIRRRLQSNGKRIPYLLLLLDEADVFIESCEAVNYKPLDALKEIQNIGVGRFKFVIAGLRNIVRFKREAALANNSVLTHLQSMTVKPFNTSEARELMEVPLHYLGLRFPKEKESLITLILATTNYFPGLIQMYCAKLLEAMRSQDYAGYNEVDTPIYEVSEKHIKKVLADPEFTQQIREKFIITLKLDEDNYYYLIALLMAYLYHKNGYSRGYSAADIQAAGEELLIRQIADLDPLKLSAFMEELRELNVFRSTDEKHYLFTRFTFFQMMGTANEVDDLLADYMKEEEA